MLFSLKKNKCKLEAFPLLRLIKNSVNTETW